MLGAEAAVTVLETVSSEPTLDELAETVRREDALAVEAGKELVIHAIAAGEALLAAKRAVGRGGWQRWLIDNCCKDPDAQYPSARLYLYMRMAINKRLVLDSGVESLNATKRLLLKSASADGMKLGHQHKDLDSDIIDAVRRKEMSQREAARRLGICAQTVRARLDGGKAGREQQRKLREARKLLRERQQRAAVNAYGGGVAETYALTRRALQHLERAVGEASSREVKEALRLAQVRLYAVEDQLAKAVRLA